MEWLKLIKTCGFVENPGGCHDETGCAKVMAKTDANTPEMSPHCSPVATDGALTDGQAMPG